MTFSPSFHCPECGVAIHLAPDYFADIIEALDFVARYIADPRGDGAATRLQAVRDALVGAPR